MASRYPDRSRKQSKGRRTPLMTERQLQAYLMARDTLRRIDRTSALAQMTLDAMTIHGSGWRPHTAGDDSATTG